MDICTYDTYVYIHTEQHKAIAYSGLYKFDKLPLFRAAFLVCCRLQLCFIQFSAIKLGGGSFQASLLTVAVELCGELL